MAKHIMVVMNDAVAGGEREFNEWYDSEHVSDVLGMGPLVSAQRFKLSDAQFEGGVLPANRYLAIYEIGDDQVEQARGAIVASRIERDEALAAGRTPIVQLSEALSETGRTLWFYDAVGPRRLASELSAIKEV